MTSYTVSLSTTAGRTLATAQKAEIKCDKGVIHQIDLLFPEGCHGLVHAALYAGGHPIAPSTEQMFFEGNGETITFKEFIPLEEITNIVTLKAYNEDDSYAHTLYARIYILPKWLLLPQAIAQTITEKVKKLIGV